MSPLLLFNIQIINNTNEKSVLLKWNYLNKTLSRLECHFVSIFFFYLAEVWRLLWKNTIRSAVGKQLNDFPNDLWIRRIKFKVSYIIVYLNLGSQSSKSDH